MLELAASGADEAAGGVAIVEVVAEAAAGAASVFVGSAAF
jgi:hypothetical protein